MKNMKEKISLLLVLMWGLIFVGCEAKLSDIMYKLADGDQVAPWDESMILAPGINLITFTAGDKVTTYPSLKGGNTYPIQWKVVSNSTGGVDPGVYSVKVEYSNDNGATWNVLSNAIATSSDQVTQYDWTLPAIAGSQYLVRVSALSVSDKTTTFQSSAPFTISTYVPIVGSFSLTPGSLGVATSNSVNRSFFGVSFTASQPEVPVKYYCVLPVPSLTSYTAPIESDPCWIDLQENAALSVNLTDQVAFIGFVPNSYDLRLWVMDAAGNISETGGGGGLGVGLNQLGSQLIVSYNPVAAPVVSNVVASNFDTVSLAPTVDQTTFTTSTPVFIRWNATDTDLLSNPITLYYTTDEITFTAIPGATNLTNSGQVGCSIDGNYTGCFKWDAAPTTGYFRIQVKVVDQTGLISKGGSSGLNTVKFKIMTGNTDTGIGGSANGAVFSTPTQSGTLVVTSKGVVYLLDSVKGVIRIDPLDGAANVYIKLKSPSSGDGGQATNATIASLLNLSCDYQDRLLIYESTRIRRVEKDGTINTIIGGGNTYNELGVRAKDFKIPALSAGATFLQPLPNGNIWFSLKHGNYLDVRWGVYVAASDKVFMVKPSGKGAYGAPLFDYSLVTDPADPIPGRLWGYTLYGSAAIPFDYRSSQTSVIVQSWYKNRPVWAGTFYNATFNSKSGANVGGGTQYPWVHAYEFKFTSRRGQLYSVVGYPYYKLAKYNPITNSYTVKLGTGSAGNCPDGTLATACAVDLQSAFVALDETIYFVSRGVVRVILPDGTVKTIFGQTKDYGVGKGPLAARYGNITHFGAWGPDNTLIINDQSEAYVKEVASGSTAVVSQIAGNGILTNPAFTAGVSTLLAKDAAFTPLRCLTACENAGFWVDDTNGNIFSYSNGNGIIKLDRADGKWHRIMGQGATNFSSSVTDILGSNLAVGWNSIGHGLNISGIVTGSTNLANAVEATANEKFIMVHATGNFSSAAYGKSYMKIMKISDGMFRHVAGNNNAVGNFWPDGTWIDDPALTYSPYQSFSQLGSLYVKEERSWLFAQGTRLIKVSFNRDGAQKITGGNLANDFPVLGARMTYNVGSFNYKFNTSTNTHDIYYCATNGNLYKYYYDTVTAKYVNTALTLPVASDGSKLYSCTGRVLQWNANQDGLIFPFTQNGLFGVGMYCTGATCNY